MHDTLPLLVAVESKLNKYKQMLHSILKSIVVLQFLYVRGMTIDRQEVICVLILMFNWKIVINSVS